ncbi:(2Fe-2S)-binding protein [Sediminispirochaeta smaragdinae]|uniref:FAD-dependent pyridine nucleotide-disulfide oxidoreductase n=1 Tax=Sediminispirochaeta smaragdinae (strain DSM 11293 / JCM 15392 / SEBR 4228) TaxID=573413 RepID=E1R3W2_SEDSS|nr:(2Fe-2S)-binding protein [Sediminispirochaeta smaragdinae]ADK82083.1 FAD-dependent pyridine nucleotide-disulfide oxidoreductase [Sediminispirochaeta smaragdinae DSM 11293]
MERFFSHPILDVKEDRKPITFFFEGIPLNAFDGEPIAVALAAAGILDVRYSRRFSQPRGIFCGIGQCQECSMLVDGVPNVRTCVTPVREGMHVSRQKGLGEVMNDGRS